MFFPPIRPSARNNSEAVRPAEAKPETRPVAPGSKPPLALVWHGAEYPRIEPGRYWAEAVRIIGPDYLARFKRYSLGIVFRLLDRPEVEVVCFLNLGSEGKPHRRSNFFRAWTMANGQPPKTGQPMDPIVFLQGQTFEVRVDDNGLDPDGEKKNEAEVYSVVRKIIRIVGTPERSNRRLSVSEILSGKYPS